MKKNTVLDDEAYIYNHHEDEKESDKWKKMNSRQKLAYFNDYYRNKVIIILIAVGLLASLFHTILSPRPEVVVSIAVINDYWDETGMEKLREDLSKYLELTEGEKEIQIDDSYFLQETGLGNEAANTQRLVAKMAAGDINVIIADKTKFEEFAESGTFLSLSEIGANAGSYKNITVSDGYGISLKGSRLLKGLGSTQKEMVLGILANTDNKDYEYLSKVIKYMLQKS